MTESPGKILIVEDNELGLKMAKKLLNMAGYQTIDAVSAEDSIRLAIQYSPDLILMDMHLPDKNGYAASQELKSIPQTAHIPIVAFTALAMPEEQKKAMEYGCIGVISKPIDATSFAKTVGSYLPSAIDSRRTEEETSSSLPDKRLKIALTPAVMQLKDFFEPLGYRVYSVEEQYEIPCVQNEPFDLLIFDESYLDAMDSQAFDDFRNELFQKKIPSILATSFSNRDLLSKTIGWVSDYITVPFLAAEVEMRVQSVIRTNKISKTRNIFEADKNRLENFLQIASHDLQGPIRKISQFVGFLSQAQQPEDTQSNEYLAGISRNVRKMEAVLANLLNSIAKY